MHIAKTDVLNLRPSFVQMTKPPWITFWCTVVKSFDSPDVFSQSNNSLVHRMVENPLW